MDTPSTVEFWDSVSKIYENSPLTKHQADKEMDKIYEIIEEHFPTVKNLICFGTADGCRDPIRILDQLKKKEKAFPECTVLNDLSSELLSVCQKRMNYYGFKKNVHYFSGPMSEITRDQLVEKYFPFGDMKAMYFCGVYNADYIAPSLEGYKQESAVIGTDFSLSPLLLVDGELVQSEGINFDINDYESQLDTIDDMKDIKNCIGYSIKTDKGFVTHYYTMRGFYDMLVHVFGVGLFGCTIIQGDRYLVSTIFDKDYRKNMNTLITTLNNVIGNIPFDQQLESLQNIKNLFF